MHNVLEAAEWTDVEAQRNLELLPGIYHCIGVQEGGSAVFRQEPSEELNNEQLLMYYYHKGVGAGWYFAKVYLADGADDWVAYSATAPIGQAARAVVEPRLAGGRAAHDVRRVRGHADHAAAAGVGGEAGGRYLLSSF